MREKKALQAPFLGACIVLISLAFPFSSTKPNRIALSEYLSFFSILQKGGLLSLLPVLSLVLGLFFAYRARYGKYPLQAALSGAFFALSGLLTLSIAVMNSAALVSPSLSFWLLIFAAWASSERAVRESRLAFFLVLALVILGFIVLLRSPGFESLAIMKEFSSRQDRFYLELLRSLNLTLMPLIAAALIGCPLGLAAYRSPRFGKAALSFAATAQTIPSLALFGILIAPLAYLSRSFPFLRELGIKGIGSAPAFIALFLYALLPIVRNTYLGFKENSLAVLESGRGMGMGAWELFQGVELPLAAPLAMRGIRTAAVQTAGTSAVAALIGAGGLGSFIFQGLGQAASDLVLLGVLPLLALALLLDRVFAIFERLATPRILRGNSQ